MTFDQWLHHLVAYNLGGDFTYLLLIASGSALSGSSLLLVCLHNVRIHGEKACFQNGQRMYSGGIGQVTGY